MSTVQRLSRISLICREPERLGCFYERAFGFVRSKQSETGGTALEIAAPHPWRRGEGH